MELSLVVVKNKLTGKSTFHAVNDKHYDAMLASGGSVIDEEYEWDWLGSVEISEEILNEQGFYWSGRQMLDSQPENLQ